MKIIQVIGYKDSGKTTTSSALIHFLTNRGVQVASLKHHGHGGVPSGIDHTDSFKHRESGATIAGVEGEGMLQFIQQGPWELKEILTIYEWMKTEVLIIEGYKNAEFPKIVLVNKEGDLGLLEQTANIVAVVTSLPLEGNEYPIFKPTELTALCEWVLEHLIEKKK